MKPTLSARSARQLRDRIDELGIKGQPMEEIAEGFAFLDGSVEQVAFATGYSISAVRNILARIRAQRPEQNV